MINIFNKILEMASDASILIIAIILLRFFLKSMPKMLRKLLWGLVGIRLLIPFSIKSIFSLVPKNITDTTDSVIEQMAVADSSSNFSFSSLLPYFWVSISILLILYGFFSFVKLKDKISDAVKEEGNVFLTEKIESPFVCGFIKPKIYFPYNIDKDTKEAILKHEHLHIRYGDHILKALGFFLVCVYWFNPLVWVSYYLFCTDIELACDEGVIKDFSAEKRKKYAEAILEIGVNKVQLSVCPVAFGEVGIKERVTSAVNYKRVTKTFALICVIACIVVGVCFMTEPQKDKLTAAIPPEKVTEDTTNLSTAEPVTEPVTEAPITTEPTTEPSATTPAKTGSTPKRSNSNQPPTLSPKQLEDLSKSEQKILEDMMRRSEYEVSVYVSRKNQQTVTQSTTDSVIEIFPEPDSPTPNTPTIRSDF